MQSLVDLVAGTVLPRVLWITVFIAVGVGLANLAVAFGLVEYVTYLAKPLTGPANLPPEVGTAIVTTAASPTAGYGMLAEYRDAGVIDDRATLVAVTINTFFGFAQHIVTFYAPVLIPILGLEVGLLYVGARAGISLAITATGVLAGALLLSGRNVDTDRLEAVDLSDDADGEETTDDQVATDGSGSDRAAADPEADDDPETPREKVREAADRTASKVREIVPRLLVVYTVVAVLTARVDLTRATAVVEPLTSLLGLPGEAVAVVAVFTLDTTNGAIVLAPMLGDVFTPRAAVATMLLGGIVSFTVSTFKRSIPFQYGIWGAEFGSKVVAVNTALKVVWIAVALAVVLALPPF